eukprot:8207070-Pyramimonas_sp.AAC.1
MPPMIQACGRKGGALPSSSQGMAWSSPLSSHMLLVECVCIWGGWLSTAATIEYSTVSAG